MTSIERMESWLLTAKTEFDSKITRDPNLSLASKQASFARFLQRIQPTVIELTVAYETRRAYEVQVELRRELNDYVQIRQRQKRGAA